MDEKLNFIKEQLGSGSINLFGLPFSGKDTVGIRLAKDLGGRFLSSGLIMRAAAENDPALQLEMNQGLLASTQKFREIVLSYFAKPELDGSPLVLGSVGRWSGEEIDVIEAAKNSNHEIRVALLLNISEAEAYKRWEAAKEKNDRGDREDDQHPEVLSRRLNEFMTKTMPVIQTYHQMNILAPVNAHTDRESVYASCIDAIYECLRANQHRQELTKTNPRIYEAS